MFDIFFIKGTSESTNFKIETCLTFIIFMLSGRSSSYVTSSKTFKTLNSFSLAKFNLLLGYVILINIIFVLGVLRRRYILSFFLRVSS